MLNSLEPFLVVLVVDGCCQCALEQH